MRRTLPMVITLVTGSLVILGQLLNFQAFSAFINDYIARSISLSQSAAIALGCLSLFRLHLNRVLRKRDGWYNSCILIFGIFFMLILGFILDRGHNDPLYNYFYQAIPVQLNNMTFALLCFYIASSSYRAFRMRSVEASLLLISACLVMVGGVSAGYQMWDKFPEVKAWIMNNFNTPAIRGMGLGITLGALAQSARNLLGIERGYMAE